MGVDVELVVVGDVTCSELKWARDERRSKSEATCGANVVLVAGLWLATVPDQAWPASPLLLVITAASLRPQ